MEKLKFFTNNILPLVYDDTLSYYELLCKVVQYLNDTIDHMNEMDDNFAKLQANFVELKNYIDNYFDNLDLQEEVNKKLDEMIADGTINSEIILKICKDMFVLKDSAKNYDLKMRLEKHSYLYNNEWLKSYETDNNPYYAWGQGFTMINPQQYVISAIPIDEKHKKTDGNAKLIKYNFDTKEPVLESILPLHHANSLTYANGKIYVAHCFKYDADGNIIYTPLLSVVNADTLQIEKTLEYKDDISDITVVFYDKTMNKLYAGNRTEFIELDITTLAKVDYFKIYQSEYANIGQSACMENGHLYYLYSKPELLVEYVFDGKGGYVVNTLHTFKNYMEDRFYKGELEDISINKDGKFYLMSMYNTGNNTICNTCQIFKGDLFNNNIAERDNAGRPTFYKTLYVDSRNNTASAGTGEENNPYNYLVEIMGNEKSAPRSMKVFIKDNDTQPFTYLSGLDNCEIIGNNTTIQGLALKYCNNVTIRMCQFKSNNKVFPYDVSLDNCSNIKFTDCEWLDNGESEAMNLRVSSFELGGTYNTDLWESLGKPFCYLDYLCTATIPQTTTTIIPTSNSGHIIGGGLKIGKEIEENKFQMNPIAFKKNYMSELLELCQSITFVMDTQWWGKIEYTFYRTQKGAYSINFTNISKSETETKFLIYENEIIYDNTQKNFLYLNKLAYNIQTGASTYNQCKIESIILNF